MRDVARDQARDLRNVRRTSIAAVGRRPKLRAVRGIDQPSGNVEFIAGFVHAPREHGAHAELFANLVEIIRRALEDDGWWT